MSGQMDRIPFTVYDFFAYLSTGFVLLASVDYAFDLRWLLGGELALVTGTFWVIAAYATGHIVANIAGHVIEGWLVRGVLGSPEEILFREREPGVRRFFLPGYHRPLPTQTRQRVLQRAEERGMPTEPGRALFFHCFEVIKGEAATLARLDDFRNLYGFCRNLCLGLLLATAVLLAGVVSDAWRAGGIEEHLWWAIVASPLAAVGLFYRYLKFYREYTVEVFRSYAESEPKGAG